MRADLLVGPVSIWLGVVFLLDVVILEGITLTLRDIGALLAGVLVIVAGVGFLFGLEEIPEDPDDKIVPPQWLWYLASVGMMVLATILTVDLLGLVEA